ncbi:MAG: V-ATPase V1 sector subunit E [Chaenotheca gracillima]|nr:MAG: V-ATPase V1 sector subunit E [Chaenotheca gracillima]
MGIKTNHVLVTGGTGFVATHVLDQLISAGYRVTATTRDASRIPNLYTDFPSYKGVVTFVSVPDFTAPGAFDHVFQNADFDYVLHVASPIPFETTELKRDLIDPAIIGTTTLLESAHKLGGSRLKRIVITGSGVSIIDPYLPPDKGREKPFDEEDWNPVTIEDAIASKNVGLAYFASKTFAERAAWDFIEREKPGFDLTMILPVIVLGPNLAPVTGPKGIEQGANAHVYKFFNGTYESADVAFNFYSHVDVRDVARAHVQALTLPSAGNQRISTASSDLLSPQTVVNILNKKFPQLGDRITKGNPDQLLPTGADPTAFSNDKAYKVFGDAWEFRSLETSVTDVVQQILEQEKTWDV